MFLNRKSLTISKLTSLNPIEDAAKNELEAVIQKGTAHQKKVELEKISKYKPSTIFKLIENSPVFKDFCNNEPRYCAELAEELKQLGYPSFEIKSVDNRESCSLLDQYMGLYLWTQYKRLNEEPELLDKACDLGFYYALVKRCDDNIEKIKKPELPEEKKIFFLQQLLKDLERLANLYWTVGYIFATHSLINVGNHYLKSEPERSDAFYAVAVENFCCAEFLSEHEMSQKLVPTIFKKGLASSLGPEFKDWDTARNYVLNTIDNDMVRYQSLRETAVNNFKKMSSNGSLKNNR